MAEITIGQLSGSNGSEDGYFDHLAATVRGELDKEFVNNRIRGPEYAQTFTALMQHTMDTGFQFLVTRQRVDLEAQLAEEHVLIAKQDVLLRTQEVALATKENLLRTQDIDLRTQQVLNAEKEYDVLEAQKCKLQAEFDLVVANTAKAGSEKTLLDQKTLTERAQITEAGVDANSVVGRQKDLYGAQTNGFARNAEQQAARIYKDIFSILRGTDPDIPASATNKFDETNTGQVMTKLMEGIGIT